jgi:ABC-type transport system involved in Fe-S cluster assembly fused permease/ATPase subunit
MIKTSQNVSLWCLVLLYTYVCKLIVSVLFCVAAYYIYYTVCVATVMRPRQRPTHDDADNNDESSTSTSVASTSLTRPRHDRPQFTIADLFGTTHLEPARSKPLLNVNRQVYHYTAMTIYHLCIVGGSIIWMLIGVGMIMVQ